MAEQPPPTLREAPLLERQQPASAVRATEVWVLPQRTADSILHACWARNRLSRNRAG